MSGARHSATVIMPERDNVRKFFEEWGFSEAIVAGDTVYVSGVVAFLRSGETDLEGAFTGAFEAIGNTLRRAGASWDDVVEMTSYHTDVLAQKDAIIKVKHRYVSPPFPAWTAIEVSRLIPDQGIAEIKVVAKVILR